MFPPFNSIARTAAGVPEHWYLPLTSPLLPPAVAAAPFAPVPVAATRTSHVWHAFAAAVGPGEADAKRKRANKDRAKEVELRRKAEAEAKAETETRSKTKTEA